ncbi:hypothetical protein N7475_008213 [Penicillium sp. IBT 31633x]|nr:hypothetical protein N7475_008213 [Penicillium sp. IBT 31633x]
MVRSPLACNRASEDRDVDKLLIDVQRSDHIPSPVDAAEPTRQRTELRANLQPRSLASLEDDISDSSGSSSLSSQHSSLIFPNDKTLLFSHQLPALEQDSANPISDSELGSSTRFPPASVLPERNPMWNANRIHPYQPSSLTDRMSRMWSLQDEAHHQAADTAIFPNVSHEDWLWLIDQLSNVNLSRYPSRVGYELPSRSALSRYLYRFLKGFHLHFPIIHSQTISIRKMAPELVLGMATIGSQYCLEHHEAKKMFTLTRDIILERVDRSQNGLDGARQLRTRTAETSGDQVPSDMINVLTHNQGFQLEACRDCRAYAWVETMQALFYLMVLATWGGESEGRSRDIATIHSLLCLLMQQQGLSETSCCLYSWESWARHESARRTKLAIFCFFSLSTVSMNAPSPILLNDIHLQLPCSTAEWEALDTVSWEMARRQSKRSLMFEQYFELLFQAERDVTACSALGSHVMIHAILQHIFYLHQVTQVSGLRGQASVEQLLSVQRALKRWRSSCGQDPDCSFTSSSPDRHIISNSVVRSESALCASDESG